MSPNLWSGACAQARTKNRRNKVYMPDRMLPDSANNSATSGITDVTTRASTVMCAETAWAGNGSALLIPAVGFGSLVHWRLF